MILKCRFAGFAGVCVWLGGRLWGDLSRQQRESNQKEKMIVVVEIDLNRVNLAFPLTTALDDTIKKGKQNGKRRTIFRIVF